MNIEKQIEDLCLERLRLEREDTAQAPADNIEQQAKAQARYQIRRAKIQAIDSQLEELRNQLAKNYKARNEGALQKEYKEVEVNIEKQTEGALNKEDEMEFGYFTVKINKKDANRLKYLFSDNDHSIQSGVIDSINAYLEKLGEKPIIDYGTGKSMKENIATLPVSNEEVAKDFRTLDDGYLAQIPYRKRSYVGKGRK